MPRHIISAPDIAGTAETVTQHQFNDNAIRHSRNLGAETGLTRIGIHQVRIEPGCESTTHHFHDADEEFIYILQGRGIARIGDEEFEIGPGDFMGFPVDGVGHSMRNPYDEDLVYLMGGERNQPDVVHYPDIGRVMIKSTGSRRWTEKEALHDLPPRR